MRVNWFLMLACVVASLYAWQIASTTSGEIWVEQNLIFSLNNFISAPWTIVTALFVHASPEHLLGNLPFLFVFGNTLEKMIGRNNHLLVFFLGGFTSFLLPPLFGIYSPDTGMLGASAAIFTLAACVMLMSPLKFSWLFLAPQGLVAIIYFTINAIIVTNPGILGQGLFGLYIIILLVLATVLGSPVPFGVF